MVTACSLPVAPEELLTGLKGVPSYHYEPVFAQRVRDAVKGFRPDCIALEIPANALGELLWAVEQWPQPCASDCGHWVYPFVPGDSILEGARLAVEQGIAIEGVTGENGINCTVSPIFKRKGPIFLRQAPFLSRQIVARKGIPVLANTNKHSQE